MPEPKKILPEQFTSLLQLLILYVLNIDKFLKADKSQITKIRNAIKHSDVSAIQLSIYNVVNYKNKQYKSGRFLLSAINFMLYSSE